MFLVSAALVVVAFVLLALGVVTAKLTLVYFAIGVAVVSMILLVVGMFLQREVFWGGGRAAAGDADAGEAEEPEPLAAASAGRPGKASVTSAATTSPAPGSGGTAERVPARAPHEVPGVGKPGAGNARGRSSTAVHEDEATVAELVHVVPGRRRYHRAGCASLVGRVSEELTIDEAREEGFSACTACFPAEPTAETGPETAAETAHETAGETASETATGKAGATAAETATEAAGGAAAGTSAETGRESARTAGAGPSGEASGVQHGTEAPRRGAGELGTPARPEESVTPAHGIALGPAAAEAAEPAAGAGTAEAAEATSDAERVPGTPGRPAPGSGETVWVVRGVSRYHRSDCVLIRSVDEEDVDTMTQADAEATGCTPCRACHAIDEPLAG